MDTTRFCIRPLAAQLDAYFEAHYREFNVPMSPNGTEFQQAVWDALSNVDYGETCSYRDIASSIGKPTATRAVGAANGANPIPIVIPCHRVVSVNGTLNRVRWRITDQTLANYSRSWRAIVISV